MGRRARRCSASARGDARRCTRCIRSYPCRCDLVIPGTVGVGDEICSPPTPAAPTPAAMKSIARGGRPAGQQLGRARSNATGAVQLPARRPSMHVTRAAPPKAEEKKQGLADKLGELTGLGDGLGPIGLTIGGDTKDAAQARRRDPISDPDASRGLEMGDRRDARAGSRHAPVAAADAAPAAAVARRPSRARSSRSRAGAATRRWAWTSGPSA